MSRHGMSSNMSFAERRAMFSNGGTGNKPKTGSTTSSTGNSRSVVTKTTTKFGTVNGDSKLSQVTESRSYDYRPGGESKVITESRTFDYKSPSDSRTHRSGSIEPLESKYSRSVTSSSSASSHSNGGVTSSLSSHSNGAPGGSRGGYSSGVTAKVNSLERNAADIPVIGSKVSLDFHLENPTQTNGRSYRTSSMASSNGEAPVFRRELKPQTFQEGDPVVFRCTLQSLKDTPNITWYKDGNPITTSQDKMMTFDGSTARLKLLEASPSDQGVYECTATTAAGIASTSANLNLSGCHESDSDEDDRKSQTQSIMLRKPRTIDLQESLDRQTSVTSSLSHDPRSREVTMRSTGSTCSSNSEADETKTERTEVKLTLSAGRVVDGQQNAAGTVELPEYRKQITNEHINSLSNQMPSKGYGKTNSLSDGGSNASSMGSRGGRDKYPQYTSLDEGARPITMKQTKQERIAELIEGYGSRGGSREDLTQVGHAGQTSAAAPASRTASVDRHADVYKEEPKTIVVKDTKRSQSSGARYEEERKKEKGAKETKSKDREREEKLKRLAKLVELHDAGKIDLSKKKREKIGSDADYKSSDDDGGTRSEEAKLNLRQEKLEKLMDLIEKHDASEASKASSGTSSSKKKKSSARDAGAADCSGRTQDSVSKSSKDAESKLHLGLNHRPREESIQQEVAPATASSAMSDDVFDKLDGETSRRRSEDTGTTTASSSTTRTKEEEQKEDSSESGSTAADMSSRTADSKRSRTRSRQTKPTFLIKPRRQFVDEGESAKFKASVEGEPQPEVEWRKDDQLLTEGKKYHIYQTSDYHFLEVLDAAESDRGQFTCTITNAVGTDTASAALDVFIKKAKTRTRSKPSTAPTPPVFTTQLTDCEVTDGNPFTLQCNVTGDPRPTIVWHHQGKVLNSMPDMKQTYEGDVAKIVFKEIYPEDDGVYDCIATNSGGETRTTARLTVQPAQPTEQAPVFTESLQKQQVCDSDRVVMTCTVTGVPTPEVKWFLAQREIKASEDFVISHDDDGLCSLVIGDVYPEDAGEYTCVATNGVGQARTSATLSVSVNASAAPAQSPPQSKPPPPPVTTKPAVSPVHQPHTDTANTAPPSTNTKEAPVTNGTSVTNGKPIDGNNNKRGGASFVQRLTDMTVQDGDSVELTVQVAGEGNCTVSWFHGNKMIRDNEIYQLVSSRSSTGVHTHTLRIGDVYVEDGGVYVCEVYNHIGEDETTCNLTVTAEKPAAMQQATVANTPPTNKSSAPVTQRFLDSMDDENFSPEFIRKPKSVIVDEGQNAQFVCQVIGKPEPEVWWEKNGEKILSTAHFKLSQEGDTYYLEINRTIGGDTGRYTVHARNSEGVEKYAISLMVKETETPDSSDFRGVLKARPIPKSLGDSLRGKAADQVDFRDVLTNKTTTKEQMNKGAEQLDFRNVLTRHVKTKQRPRVLVDPQDVVAVKGSSITIKCKIAAQPAPKITWYMNKKEIKESRYFKMSYHETTASLQILEVYSEDEGEYLCLASNEAGNAHTTCELKVTKDSGHQAYRTVVTPSDVTEPPFIEDLSPENIHVLCGRKFQLRGKYTGEPAPEVKWFRDRTLLKADHRVKIEQIRDSTLLTITEAEVNDTGKYTLIIENELGKDTCTSSVTVEDRPDPPVDVPAVSNITLNSMTLSWYGPSYDGGSAVTDYKVEMCRNSSVKDWKTLTSNCKHTTYQVKNLDPNTEYHFRVSAANKHGFSDPGRETPPIMTVDARGDHHQHHHSTTPHTSTHTPHARRGSRDHRGSTPNNTAGSTSSTGGSGEAQGTTTRGKRPHNELTFEPREVKLDTSRSFYDNYIQKEEIGKGRFGNVYKCVQKSDQQEFAAKFIRVKSSERQDTRQEIAIMNQLHHPKLLQLWDAFESRKEIVIITEHVQGGELFARIIDDDYILTERECIHFLRQICDGIQFMHQKSILHLDIKPENILCVTKNSNEIKIIDFGLAREYDPASSFKVMFGTPEFVAPEVVNYDLVNFFTDMWSVGVVTYILLSGLSPFLGDKDSDTFANVTSAQWDFEDEAFDEISDDAKDFISRLLIKDKGKRMSSTSCLEHSWLSQDVKYMRAKRLSTEKHKKFLARGKWQKTGNAIRALGRMAAYTKSPSVSKSDSSPASSVGSGGDTTRQASVQSDYGVSPDVSGSTPARERTRRAEMRRAQAAIDEQQTVTSSTSATTTNATALPKNEDSGIDAKMSDRDTSSEDSRSTTDLATTTTTSSSAVTSATRPRRYMTGGSKDSPDDADNEATETEDLDEPPPVSTAPPPEGVQNGEGEGEGGPVGPQFVQELGDVQVSLGETAVFKAKISSQQKAEVMWLKDNIEISGRRYEVERSGEVCTLTIKRCRTFDRGMYECSASNRDGQAQSTARLSVT